MAQITWKCSCSAARSAFFKCDLVALKEPPTAVRLPETLCLRIAQTTSSSVTRGRSARPTALDARTGHV